MAQVFPLNVDDLAGDEAQASLSSTLAALPDPWTLLRNRRIGDAAEPVEVVLVHPEIGVALVDEAPRDPGVSARELRQYLDAQRFGEFFPGDLPIVALSIAPDDFETVGEQLAAAFEASPRLSIADADWADAVVELLMVPDDLAMAPVGETARGEAPVLEPASAGDDPFEEPLRILDEPLREPARGARGERFDDARHVRRDADRREWVGEEPLELNREAPFEGEPPLPLMVDWPFGESYERRRRRGRTAALAVVLLLLAGGVGFAAWEYVGDDLTMTADRAPTSRSVAPRSQIEIPLPPQSSARGRAAANPAPATPPPVPAAPPVVLAQKPYAPPPPKPPKPTPVAPLPQVAVAAPPSPPPAPAPPPQPPAPERTAAAPAPATDSGSDHASTPKPAQAAKAAPAAEEAPAEETAAVVPPPPAKPAPPPAKHKATQTAKAEPLPRSIAPARQEPSQPSRPRPSEESAVSPPIDAADLPPLEQAPTPRQPQRPTQFAAPSATTTPAAAAALGPPVPLWRAQANNAPPPAAATPAASAAPINRECRPYTSSTTLTGRGLRVEGIACRGNDGQWRLVSEVPMR